MNPLRAKELLDARSDVIPGARLLEVSSIRKVMSADEIEYLASYLETLPSNASIVSALTRIAKGEGPSPNTNCLQDYKCPECGSHGPFDLRMACTATLSDNGVDNERDYDWDAASMAECLDCGHRDEFSEFNTHNQESEKSDD